MSPCGFGTVGYYVSLGGWETRGRVRSAACRLLAPWCAHERLIHHLLLWLLGSVYVLFPQCGAGRPWPGVCLLAFAGVLAAAGLYE